MGLIMRCSSVSLSEIGLRSRNEDSFLQNCETGIFVVADGLGGHSDGDVASALAVDEAVSRLRQLLFPREATTLGRALEDVALAAHRRIVDANDGRLKTHKMATTITILVLENGV